VASVTLVASAGLVSGMSPDKKDVTRKITDLKNQK
jgi:hypothetical protein